MGTNSRNHDDHDDNNSKNRHGLAAMSWFAVNATELCDKADCNCIFIEFRTTLFDIYGIIFLGIFAFIPFSTSFFFISDSEKNGEKKSEEKNRRKKTREKKTGETNEKKTGFKIIAELDI